MEAFVASVTAALKRGEEVRLIGFGSFTPIARAAGLARNPRTGAQVKRPASKTARFRIGEALKSALELERPELTRARMSPLAPSAPALRGGRPPLERAAAGG